MTVPKLTGELLSRWPEWSAGDDRRAMAELKLSFYGDRYLPKLQDYIKNILGPKDPNITKFVQRMATRSPNLLRAVCDAVSVSYRRGARRTLYGASPEAQRAFSRLVAESGMNRLQSSIATKSWLQGPVLCVPYFDSRGKVAIQAVNADRFDIRRERDYVEEALWYWEGNWIHLDADQFNYYNSKGEYVKSVPHGAGVCPARAFTSTDNRDDFWCVNDHGGLLDATLMVGFKAAAGSFHRWVGGTKLVAVFTNPGATAEGQDPSHPVAPLVLPRDAKLQVEDRVVNSADYLNEISAIVSMAISSEGLPPGSVTMVANQGEYGTIAIATETGRLGILRDLAVPHLRDHELAFWPIAVEMVRNSPHPLAGALPPPDEVAQQLRVAFPDLSSPTERKTRLEVLKMALPLGIASVDEFILEERPELSPEDAEELTRTKLDQYINLIKPLVERNTPAEAPNGEGYQSIAQRQGREGGQASGVSRSSAADRAAAENGETRD